jgi:peptide/nickel transport system permease protein
MREYIIRRLLLLPLIMLGVSFLTFALFHFAIPGDACALTLGFGATPETVEACQQEHGLDRPWYEQYWDWLNGIPQGDFGKSLNEGELPVTQELERRLPITIELMLLTLLFAIILGIPPGVLSAIRSGTPLDWVPRFTSVIWLSIPNFYLGILVITFASVWFGWTPPQFELSYVSFFDDPLTNLEEFVLPSLVLSVGISAVIMRLTRSAMLEVMRNDYIRTAWSKGLRERTVVWRHALKNALIPVVTVIGLQVGALIGGAVLIEAVFNLNGIGKYVLEAIVRRDFFVVQSMVLLFALVYVTANLVVDIAYAWLDPRIHYG